MANKYVGRLIRNFFENDFSEEIRSRFGQWLLSDGAEDEKSRVMREIWEKSACNKKDENTWTELNRLRHTIERSERQARLSQFKRFARVAAILLLPLLGAVSAYFLKPDTVRLVEPEIVECFVPYGEMEHLFLPDSSEVWLNAGSLLLYAREFNGETRNVYLNGEANFKVAKDLEKPFIVKTEYMDIEALGTVFNVQAYSDTRKIMATLEEGKVKVDTKGNNARSYILSPDEEVVYDRATQKSVQREVDASKDSQWKMGYLVFQGNTFEEIMRSIERRFDVSVNYDSDKFAGRSFTIRFSPEEELRQVFEIMKVVGKFNYQIKDNVVFIN